MQNFHSISSLRNQRRPISPLEIPIKQAEEFLWEQEQHLDAYADQVMVAKAEARYQNEQREQLLLFEEVAGDS